MSPNLEMQVIFNYPENGVFEIKEAALPENWHETNIASFDRIADIYDMGIKDEQKRKPTSAVTDITVAQILRENNYGSILDIGIGDGERLANIIKNSGRNVRGLGTELSDRMIGLARANGFHVEKHDLRNKLPFNPESIDCVAYLTGDLGYLMNTRNGFDLRVNALNSAFSTLKPNGTFFVEMISNDTPEQGIDGNVLAYTSCFSTKCL